MVHQHQRIANQARQQARRLADGRPAELEVAEAARLERRQVGIVGCEERVQRHGEDVDDAGAGLAGPVEARQGGDDGAGVFEVGDGLRGEQRRERDDVVEGDRHAAAGERVAHVHCVAEHDQARCLLRRGWEEGVRHGAQFSRFDGFSERGLDTFWEVWKGDVEHVVFHAAGFGAGAGQAVGNVDEDARLVGADLVDEDGRGVGEDDVAVVGPGEVGVDHFEAPEFAADLGLVGDVFFAEFRGVAVCY